jgi:hypothetical protein
MQKYESVIKINYSKVNFTIHSSQLQFIQKSNY